MLRASFGRVCSTFRDQWSRLCAAAAVLLIAGPLCAAAPFNPLRSVARVTDAPGEPDVWAQPAAAYVEPVTISDDAVSPEPKSVVPEHLGDLPPPAGQGTLWHAEPMPPAAAGDVGHASLVQPWFTHTDPNDPYRHVGVGRPLIGTSWLNRPWYVGAFLGGLLADDLISERSRNEQLILPRRPLGLGLRSLLGPGRPLCLLASARSPTPPATRCPTGPASTSSTSRSPTIPGAIRSGGRSSPAAWACRRFVFATTTAERDQPVAPLDAAGRGPQVLSQPVAHAAAGGLRQHCLRRRAAQVDAELHAGSRRGVPLRRPADELLPVARRDVALVGRVCRTRPWPEGRRRLVNQGSAPAGGTYENIPSKPTGSKAFLKCSIGRPPRPRRAR